MSPDSKPLTAAAEDPTGVEASTRERSAAAARLSRLFRNAGKDTTMQALYRTMLEHRMEEQRCKSST